MDKKTSKKIDEVVSKIKMDIWQQAIAITEEVQREIEIRLIQTIRDRWDYMDRRKENENKR